MDTFDQNTNCVATVALAYVANHVVTHSSEPDAHSTVAHAKKENSELRKTESAKRYHEEDFSESHQRRSTSGVKGGAK